MYMTIANALVGPMMIIIPALYFIIQTYITAKGYIFDEEVKLKFFIWWGMPLGSGAYPIACVISIAMVLCGIVLSVAWFLIPIGIVVCILYLMTRCIRYAVRIKKELKTKSEF